MDVVAKLRYLRISPRKVRLVLDLVRGKDLAIAETQLQYLPKASSRPLMKLLKSAAANAEHNFKLDRKGLYIKQAFADEGPKLKRYQPHAMGRATEIRKRSSHVTVVLASRSEPPPQASRGKIPKVIGDKPVSAPSVTTEKKPVRSAADRGQKRNPKDRR